jgi:hypothetical protein
MRTLHFPQIHKWNAGFVRQFIHNVHFRKIQRISINLILEMCEEILFCPVDYKSSVTYKPTLLYVLIEVCNFSRKWSKFFHTCFCFGDNIEFMCADFLLVIENVAFCVLETE